MSFEEEAVDPAEEVLANARKATESLTRGCLSDMVVSLNEQKLKLLMTIKDLKQQLAQQKSDQADIYFYLNKKCDDSFEVIAALEEQMTAEQTDREISETIFEKKIADLQANSEAMQAKYKARIIELEDKLANMKEYSDNKAAQDAQLQNLIDTLDMERRKYVQTTEELENRLIIEKDRIQREFDLKASRMQGEIASKVGDQLSITTKETQSKNVFLKHELRKQSVEADKVLHISSNIMSKEKSMKIDLDLALANEKELINKLATYQKVIKQLNEKIESDEKKFDFLKSETAKTIDEQKAMIESLQSELKIINDKKLIEDTQLDEMWIFLSSSYASLTKEKEAKYGKMRSRHGSVGSLSIGSASQTKGNYEGILTELILTLMETYPQRFASVIDDYLESNPHFSESCASNQRIDTLKELSQLQIGMDSFYSMNQNQASVMEGFLPDITGKAKSGKDRDNFSFGGGISWAESSVTGGTKATKSIGTQVDMTVGVVPSYSRMPPDLLLGLGRELEDGGHSIYSAPNNPFGGLDGMDGINNSSIGNSVKSAYYGQAKYTLSNSKGRGKSKGNTKLQKSSPVTQASESKVHNALPGSNQSNLWRPSDELKKENIRMQRYYPALDRDSEPKFINSPIRTNSQSSITDSVSANQIDDNLKNYSRSKKSLEFETFSVAGQAKSILTGADRVGVPAPNRVNGGSIRTQRNMKKFGGKGVNGNALDDNLQNKSVISEISIESRDFAIESPRNEDNGPSSSAAAGVVDN